MVIKKWTRSPNNNIKIILKKRFKGDEIMAVSMATIPVIKGEAARQMVESLKTPTITRRFIEECKRETKGIIIKRIK